MAEKIITYPVNMEHIQEVGDTTRVVVLKPYAKLLEDGSYEEGAVMKHFVIYGGKIESVSSRRIGAIVPDMEKIDSLESFVVTPIRTPSRELSHLIGISASLVYPNPTEIMQGGKPLLQLIIPQRNS